MLGEWDAEKGSVLRRQPGGRARRRDLDPRHTSRCVQGQVCNGGRQEHGHRESELKRPLPGAEASRTRRFGRTGGPEARSARDRASAWRHRTRTVERQRRSSTDPARCVREPLAGQTLFVRRTIWRGSTRHGPSSKGRRRGTQGTKERHLLREGESHVGRVAVSWNTKEAVRAPLCKRNFSTNAPRDRTSQNHNGDPRYGPCRGGSRPPRCLVICYCPGCGRVRRLSPELSTHRSQPLHSGFTSSAQ